MITDEAIFDECAKVLKSAGGGTVGNASPSFISWLKEHGVPSELIDFFKSSCPKTELWAGAGVLFDEAAIVKWNDWHPTMMKAGLLLVGSGPDGTHIVVDFSIGNGQVGYVCHECDLAKVSIRKFYVPVEDSLGKFLQLINKENSTLPDDYREAIEQNPLETKH